MPATLVPVPRIVLQFVLAEFEGVVARVERRAGAAGGVGVPRDGFEAPLVLRGDAHCPARPVTIGKLPVAHKLLSEMSRFTHGAATSPTMPTTPMVMAMFWNSGAGARSTSRPATSPANRLPSAAPTNHTPII